MQTLIIVENGGRIVRETYEFLGGAGSIINEGEIVANRVALIGKTVLNSGTVVAQDGAIIMAARM